MNINLGCSECQSLYTYRHIHILLYPYPDTSNISCRNLSKNTVKQALSPFHKGWNCKFSVLPKFTQLELELSCLIPKPMIFPLPGTVLRVSDCPALLLNPICPTYTISDSSHSRCLGLARPRWQPMLLTKQGFSASAAFSPSAVSSPTDCTVVTDQPHSTKHTGLVSRRCWIKSVACCRLLVYVSPVSCTCTSP